jgi:hypothetical protein
MPRYYDYEDDDQEEKRSYKRQSEELECPFCEEHFFMEQPEICEKPKKKHCHDIPEKLPCPPPDWCKCPPPWFWCKPEHEDKKARQCDCREWDCDRKEERNKPKKDSCEIEAYGYVYSLTATAVTLLTNTDVLYTNNGPLDDITHTPNTAQIFIRKSGVYQIFYNVNLTAAVAGLISIAVNGSVDPSTTIPAIAAGETSGKALLNLRAGDFITLRNSSAVTLTLAVAPAIGSQLVLERLDEIECHN